MQPFSFNHSGLLFASLITTWQFVFPEFMFPDMENVFRTNWAEISLQTWSAKQFLPAGNNNSGNQLTNSADFSGNIVSGNGYQKIYPYLRK